MFSVPARHIYEGAAPCSYCLAPCPTSLAPCPIYIAPCPNLKENIIIFVTYNFGFGVFIQLMNCTMLADLYPCFHRSPTKLCPDLVSFACWIVPKFWAFACKCARLGHSRSKQCPICCRLHTKLCPNFGRSHARLCPIYFAACPFDFPT